MPNFPLLRTMLILALLPQVAACATGAPAPWQKPGATAATTTADSAQCRAAAQQQTARLYPYGSGSPTLGGAGMIASQQQASTDRTSAEAEAFNDCMEARGYARKPAS
jgi:hypothetical protein